MAESSSVLDTLLQLGDSALIASQRLCERFGQAPTLAQDQQWLSIGMELLEQSRQWLEYAAELLNDGRDADQLAFLRDARQFHNLVILEQPHSNPLQAGLCHWLYDGWHQERLSTLQLSPLPLLAITARRALPQVRAHWQHANQWLLDASAQDRPGLQHALDQLWPLCQGVPPDNPDTDDKGIDRSWRMPLKAALARAGLAPPRLAPASQSRDHAHLQAVLQPLQGVARTAPHHRW